MRRAATGAAPRDGALDLFAATPLATARAASVPGASPESALPVATLTQTARDILEGALPPLWVRGEVSDFKRHRNGHWYFCLRDESAQLRCVVWARDQRGIPAAPDDGMLVLAFGQLTVYPARGEMHLTVRRMEAHGDGLWRKALEETRARLERDGLLAPERRRRIPSFPRCVAVVTSLDGAALRDVIAVVRRRAPHVRVVASGATVQGDGAPESICAALSRVERWGGADVVIVGRGGGAREDLWAFNDERVARAIAAFPVPVISAVGHEIDVTISDLVADLRAPTPSAAAEAAVPERDLLLATLRDEFVSLESVMSHALAERRAELAAWCTRAQRCTARDNERRQATLAAAAGRLDALSPLATLARGYTIAREPERHRAIVSASDAALQRPFELLFRDGTVIAQRVEEG